MNFSDNPRTSLYYLKFRNEILIILMFAVELIYLPIPQMFVFWYNMHSRCSWHRLLWWLVNIIYIVKCRRNFENETSKMRSEVLKHGVFDNFTLRNSLHFHDDVHCIEMQVKAKILANQKWEKTVKWSSQLLKVCQNYVNIYCSRSTD